MDKYTFLKTQTIKIISLYISVDAKLCKMIKNI